jgi:Fur family transcriptional regulator, stress-responsive regulator
VQPTAQELRGKGLRVTAQRQAVLAALTDRPHASAADLAAVLGVGVLTGPSKQGLYNVLDDLTRVGLVRCIEPAGSAARYELRVGDNHHHVVCRSCGRMEDVDCAVGAAPCLEPAESATGFVVDEAEVTWWGRCAACREEPSDTTANHEHLTKEI